MTRVTPELTTVATVKLPEITNRRGGGVPSPYPFDSLELGASFGVKNKDKKAMTSIVSNQNRKFKVTAKDEAGNDQTVVQKHFYVRDVDAETKKAIKGTPLDGSTSIVTRDK